METSAPSSPPGLTADHPIRIGTRKSALALAQATHVSRLIENAHPHLHFAIQGMHSSADLDKTTALYAFGGKGLWTNELEARLLSSELDLVVHSLKDMPTVLPAGCILATVPAREDARDVVVAKKSLQGKYKSLADLPPGSVVGTSSVRRMAQVRRRYPELSFKDMRGNIDTRLRKLDDEESEYSVLILAAAGLSRMGLLGRVTQFLDGSVEGGGMLHAVGQGGLGIETREGDERIHALLDLLEDKPTRIAAEAERSVMRTLEGGCSVPIGVETSWVGESRLLLKATVVSVDGTQAVDGECEEEVRSQEEAVALGKKVAAKLVEDGAQTILDAITAEKEKDPDAKEKWVPA